VACGDKSMMRRVRVFGPQSTGRTTTWTPVAGLADRNDDALSQRLLVNEVYALYLLGSSDAPDETSRGA